MIFPHKVLLPSSRYLCSINDRSLTSPSAVLADVGDDSVATFLVTTLARGGAEFFAKRATHLDISRVRMRLEGLQAYGTLCAVLANGCLRLYSAVNVPKKEHDLKLRKRIALDAFFLSIVVSVMSGTYTTVVFTLLALLSKTALGRGFDSQFLNFWAATASIRETGFQAFLLSLVSFEVAFILSLYLRIKGRRKRIMVIFSTAIALFSFSQWITVMKLSSKFLFTLHAEVDF